MLADHWVPLRPGRQGTAALALVAELAGNNGPLAQRLAPHPELAGLVAGLRKEELARRAGMDLEDLRALGRRLAAAQRPAVLPPGPVALGDEGVAGQAAVVLLNYLLGAYQNRWVFGPSSALATLTPAEQLQQTLEALAAGTTDVLVLAHQNPLFDLPGGLPLRAALEGVGLVVALADRMNATTELADVVLPCSTPLESWGDYSPYEGMTGLYQPSMARLYDTRSTGDVLLGLARAARLDEEIYRGARSFAQVLRRRWLQSGEQTGRQAVTLLRQAQQRGGWFVEMPRTEVTLQPALAQRLETWLGEQPPQDEGEGLRLAPYAPIGAGVSERALGGWLDELPEPTTAAVWGSSAEIHPDVARRLGVNQGDVVAVTVDDRSIELPVTVRDNVRPDAVAVPLGGRPEGLASALTRLLPATAWAPQQGLMRAGWPVEVQRGQEVRPLFVETRHFDQHHRGLARAQGVEDHHHAHPELPREQTDMYPRKEYPTHRWGMVIDLDRCTGCSACIVACFAENNISVVGPEQVDYGRELAWLQIHTYWERDHADRPVPLFLPVMCQHCHQAPCESVCPVYAPYHTEEGLNGQVYNRCVGTRFCANNCPYKVRKFNWYDWPRPEPLPLQLNPDVTVRSAGVMEKCTFCMQRIRVAKETAKLENRELTDGEVLPACVQTCPTSALVFGDLTDPGSEVSRLARSDRGYHLLGHVGTRPAITYLERVVRWRS
jgi:molybdopterin-containing oxidoreductase family iron-sulfur binding subunit